MIPLAKFEDELRTLGIDPSPLGRLVSDPATASHFVVAGPGTGKTTALAVRAIKLVLVDGLDPGSIIATTFTRRAAAELRSRILQRADQIRKSLVNQSSGSQKTELVRIDFNRIRTGTLDSLCEEILTDFRPLGSVPPVIIDGYVADSLMLTKALFNDGRHKRTDVIQYAKTIIGTTWGLSPKRLASLVREVHDRTIFDQVDMTALRNSNIHPGMPFILDAIADYRALLDAQVQYDYALLEERLLRDLTTGRLTVLTGGLRAVLVDEYQDTNYLQERIYFQLAKAAIGKGGGLTVVGDDDQALFRFRGATTDLFVNFRSRARKELGVTPSTVFLRENRRSTDEIVAHVNNFVTLDPGYQRGRAGGKPPLVRMRSSAGHCPILGMFRPNIGKLADDLTLFIKAVVNGQGFRVPGTEFVVRKDASGGSAADLIFLSSSPEEVSAGGTNRLPLELRTRLSALNPPINVYNPRGRPITSVPDVSILLGLCLRCIDPRQEGPRIVHNLPPEAVATFSQWRATAVKFIRSNPSPKSPVALRSFVNSWVNRNPSRGSKWPRDASLLKLVYSLITWMPFFQTDLEGLAYLEVINRTATSAGSLGKYDASLLDGPKSSPFEHQNSLAELYWNFFVPLALDFIDVDEEVLETLPRDRLGIFSIHQAKGLEFPLVIVDVGSSFTYRAAGHRFKRFPNDEGNTSRLEDQLRNFSPLKAPQRPGLDRCYDDLIRQFFVSYSRPQDVLLLVGLDTLRQQAKTVESVATGWIRDGSWTDPNLAKLTHI